MTSPTMDDPNNPLHPDYQLGLEASQWLVRLRDSEPQPDDPYFDPKKRNAAFLEWLRRSSLHVALFLDTYETYRRLGTIDSQRRIDIAALLSEAAKDSIQDRQQSHTGHAPSLPGSQRRFRNYLARSHAIRWAAAAGIAGMALVLANGWRLEVLSTASATATSYSSAVGERRVITLEDGSQLTLNTASRIEVTFTRDMRQVRLISGEVLAQVYHDAARPFLVESDDVRIFDIGTQFDVYKRDNGVRVSVIEGRVHLTCACSGQKSRPTTISANSMDVTLGQGDQANVTVERGVSTLERRKQTEQELQSVTAWTEGHLSFSGESLSDVVKEFNRYNDRHFIIADPDIANYPIAGFFPSPNPDKLLEALHEQGISALALDPTDPTSIRLTRNSD